MYCPITKTKIYFNNYHLKYLRLSVNSYRMSPNMSRILLYMCKQKKKKTEKQPIQSCRKLSTGKQVAAE